MIARSRLLVSNVTLRRFATWAECQSAISKERVVVFAKSYCPYCKKTKEGFQAHGITPKVFELDLIEGGAAIQSELAATTKLKTVPNVFVGGQHIGDSSKCAQMWEDGSMQAKLDALESAE